MSKETFKMFARKNPSLATNVINGKTSWQQLYELYEIYGEDNKIWNNFIDKDSVIDNISTSATTMKEFINTFKNLDMDSVQKGITNIQKTIGLLQDLGIGNKLPNNESRPIYQRFDS
ncbi:MAG: hypothetical protein IKE63_01815 [Bacilli bacterium]|nr:hypothetical protein [Bacilli bacterium]